MHKVNFFWVALYLSGCGSASPTIRNEPPMETTAARDDQARVERSVPYLHCDISKNPTMNVNGEPSVALVITADGPKALGQLVDCRKTSRKSYDMHSIPSTTLEAVGGFFAGAGDWYHLSKTDSGFEITHISTDEGTDGPLVNVVMRLSAEGRALPESEHK